MKPISRQSLEPLTGARFLAALWVVLYHSTTDFGFKIPSQPSRWSFFAIVKDIVSQGYLAVDFFFLLSGFILAYNYISFDGTVRGGKRAFWIARIARIYPVYLLGIALGLVSYFNDKHRLVAAAITIALHILLTQSWIPQALAFDLNPPAWSLAAEALFYALFPFLLPLCARLGRRLLPFVAGASWGLYVFALAALTALGQGMGLSSNSLWGKVISFNPLVRLPEFLVGLALGLMFANAHIAVTPIAKMFRPLTVRSHDLGIAFALGALGIVFVLVSPIVDHVLQGYASAAIAGIVIPLFVLLIYLLALRSGLFAKILSLSAVTWLGEISYGVYILHWPLWYLWHTYAQPLLPLHVNSVWSLILYLFVLVTVAGLSFTYLEGPARRLIRAWWAKPKLVEDSASQRVAYDPLLVETVKRQVIPRRFE